MQTDARLIENIKHIYQLRPYLGGQSYALTFASRKRCCRTIKRKIFQPHAQHKFQSATYFFHHFRSYGPLLFGEMVSQIVYPFAQFRNIHFRKVGNIFTIDVIMESLFVETIALTLRAHTSRIELPCPFLSLRRGIVALLHLYIFQQSVVRHKIVLRTHRFGLDVQSFIGSIHYFIERFFGNFAQGRSQVHTIFFTYCLDLPEDKRIFIFSEREYAACMNRYIKIGHYFIAVDNIHVSQSLALRASTLRTIEREIVRSWLHIRQSGHGVHKHFAIVPHLRSLVIENHQLAIALLKCHLGSFA